MKDRDQLEKAPEPNTGAPKDEKAVPDNTRAVSNTREDIEPQQPSKEDKNTAIVESGLGIDE